MSRAPLDPTVMKAWNKGREAGIREGAEEGREQGWAEATQKFLELTASLTDIKGIGEQRAQAIQMHFLKGLEKLESKPK